MEYYTAKENERAAGPSGHVNNEHDEAGKGKTHGETERHSLRGVPGLKRGKFDHGSQNGGDIGERRLGWGLGAGGRVLGVEKVWLSLLVLWVFAFKGSGKLTVPSRPFQDVCDLPRWKKAKGFEARFHTGAHPWEAGILRNFHFHVNKIIALRGVLDISHLIQSHGRF